MFPVNFLTIFIFIASISESQSNRKSSRMGNDDLSLLDFLLKNYDRRALPTANKGKPTIVSCEIYIRSFGSINPATMDYETDLYLRQDWIDDRLKTPNFSKPLDLNDPTLVKMIWKPEVFFPNAKHAEFQYVTVPNVLVRIYPSGDILYMLRLKLRFSCMMDLYRYPMDSQICSMELASCEYSCLKADFYLQRSLGYHMVQSYLPTSLIVFISWVSFWLDVDAIPARVTLGVTTLLTISSKGSGIQSNLPPVSYVKAIDVWMGACITFVFSALLEFTFVNYVSRRQNERKARLHSKSNTDSKPPMIAMNQTNEQISEKGRVNNCEKQIIETKISQISQHSTTTSVRSEKCDFETRIKPNGEDFFNAEHIDRFCRFLFPLLFALFNVLYWPYYISRT